MELKNGQIWKETDNRFTIHVRILSADHFGRVLVENVDTGRKTTACKERFNGKQGYRLIKES